MSFYNGIFMSSMNILPLQMIPLKKKDEKWKKDCMDALETIGRQQYNSNLHLIENYEMIKGKFIYSHYLHTDGYNDMVNQLSSQFELPKYLRHYDKISPIINILSGEWQKRPDIFRVKEFGESATNEYTRTKTDLTIQWIYAQINGEINNKLIQKGIDPNKTDFNSPEEKQQYMQQVAQMRQSMTPAQIQDFMDSDFLTLAENWGQHQLEFDREYFNLPEKEKKEFEDMLVADRCFRHFMLTPKGYDQETWNPINVFYHKSPDIDYIEEGDYVGRCFNISINTIIDRYGYLMDKDDIKALQGDAKDDNKKWVDSDYNWLFKDYMVPFEGYPMYDIMRKSWNINNPGENQSVPWAENNLFNNMVSRDGGYLDNQGFYLVTEGYWKTLVQIIKITYFDEETGQIVVNLVDETYVIPSEFSESPNAFAEDHDVNTYVKTWVPRVMKGIKINTSAGKTLNRDLYLAVKLNDYQFTGDSNIYGSKLPVCGRIFSVRNSQSASLVDMLKPFQIGCNLALNQLYHFAEKEIGMFLVMDVNMFPNSKDWGGEDSWSKWMMLARDMGMLPADTSPQNVKNSLATTGGFLPKVINLDMASQMVSRMNIAKFFEEQMFKLVGFNEARLGEFTQTDTNKGIEQGIQASYNQTESYFTNFSNYLRRCKQMGLEMARYVQSQNKDITFTYIKGDFSRAFVKIAGTDIELKDLGIITSNSQEAARQLAMMEQYAMGNNTAGLTPLNVFDIISMNNPKEIRKQLEVSYNKVLQQQQQAQQLQQQELDQEQQLKVQQLQQVESDKQADRQNKLDVAYIQAGKDIINSSDQPTGDNTALKSQALTNKQQSDANTNDLKAKKLELDRAKQIADTEINIKKLDLERQKIIADQQIQDKKTESARILKGQEVNKKNNQK